jgi:hypothetical protein
MGLILKGISGKWTWIRRTELDLRCHGRWVLFHSFYYFWIIFCGVLPWNRLKCHALPEAQWLLTTDVLTHILVFIYSRTAKVVFSSAKSLQTDWTSLHMWLTSRTDQWQSNSVFESIETLPHVTHFIIILFCVLKWSGDLLHKLMWLANHFNIGWNEWTIGDRSAPHRFPSQR